MYLISLIIGDAAAAKSLAVCPIIGAYREQLN